MANSVTNMVDHFFREEYGKAVSFLTVKYGSQNLELAEDSVQEALYKAMQTWPYAQIPKNPSGWIITVASNKMIDHFRRASRMDHTEKLPESSEQSAEPNLESINDDQLKMMFACCDPSLSAEYQIILILKILGGLSVKEIARVLLKKEETVAKAYTRSKQKFKQEDIALELPSRLELKNRLNTVLQVIYLLFTEGYKTTSGDQLLKKDLCLEAIRLNGILLESQICNTSRSNALMALMHFHASRFDTRIDDDGHLITLEFQNRQNWDQQYIDKGKFFLVKATKGEFLNQYYIQAAISGLHCEAKIYSDTNWHEILSLYTILLRLNPSPVIRLNRAVAIFKAQGAQKALEELIQLEQGKKLENHHMFYAVKGEVLNDLGLFEKAGRALEKAIELTGNLTEKEHLRSKIKC